MTLNGVKMIGNYKNKKHKEKYGNFIILRFQGFVLINNLFSSN